MSAARERREAAKNLGIALQVKYRQMIEANGEEAITLAAIDLGNCFNSNIEFIIWCLKEFGGVQQLPFERIRKAMILMGFDPGTDMGSVLHPSGQNI